MTDLRLLVEDCNYANSEVIEVVLLTLTETVGMESKKLFLFEQPHSHGFFWYHVW